MSLNIINITIPNDKILPEEIYSFSPEENYKMLKIGSECLIEGRKTALEISQKEIYEKVKDEYKEDIKKLEIDILVERELAKKIGEKMSQFYDAEVENLKKQNGKIVQEKYKKNMIWKNQKIENLEVQLN